MAGAREITQAAKRDQIREQRAREAEETGALQARRDLVARRAEQTQRNEEAVAAQKEADAPENNLPLGSKELRQRELENQAAQAERNAEVKAAEGAPENKALTGPPENKAAEPDITDAAAELAAEYGIDVNTVKGSGADGRITKGDVEDAIKAQGAE